MNSELNLSPLFAHKLAFFTKEERKKNQYENIKLIKNMHPEKKNQRNMKARKKAIKAHTGIEITS